MPPKSHNSTRTASLTFEQTCWQNGSRVIVGLDEAGRGTWAGPVSAGAVCLPLERPDLTTLLQGVRDSKQLSGRRRSQLVETIQNHALAWGVGSASSEEIDQIGIVSATRLAMKRALAMTALQPDFLLLDSIAWKDETIPYLSIIKGDSLSLSIAAASILAKVWRDEHMRELDQQYPEYGFAAHKGYGTPQHQAALRQHGPTPIHRMSFAPLRQPALWDKD